MKTLIVLAALVAVACAAKISEQKVQEEWQKFKTTHGKTYASTEEEQNRMKIFKENLIRIDAHNKRQEQGLESFRVGVNHLADLHTHEIAERLNGLIVDKAAISARKHNLVHRAPLGANLKWHWWCLWWCDDDDDDNDDSDDDSDDSDDSKDVVELDWRDSGYVTEVKDQGQCGGCWSFSSTGALEGQFYKKNGKLVSLSEQNLMDCSWKYGNLGCNGGLMTSAFSYVKANGGIDTETSYPWTGKSSRTCKYTKANSGGSISKYVEVNPTEADLKDAVTTVGPIAVGIDASQWSFNYYESGVYDETKCSSNLDHAVLIVGYGREDGKDYWLVKNSWGTSWGEKGYIKMVRGKNNQCGIADMASYPVV